MADLPLGASARQPHGLTRTKSRRAEEKSANFRAKFELPAEESIVDDWSCAIQKDILLHGRMYVSQRFVCFYSNIFGHRTMEVLPFDAITAIEKKNTSLFVPNAIEISVRTEDGAKARHFFASFQHRDTSVGVLRRLWAEHQERRSRPQEPEPEPEPELPPFPDDAGSPPAAQGAAAGAEEGEEGEEREEDEADIMLVAEEKQEAIKMKELISFTLESCDSCVDFFEEFFSDASATSLQYHEQRGDTACELTAWQKGTSLGYTRTVRWRAPVKGAPIGPKITAAEETQRYQLSSAGLSLLVETEAMYPSVPYGECFRVETHYSIAIVDGSAKIVVTSGVRWLKSTWWKSFIAQGVESESRTSFELWARLVKAQWQERLQEQARGRAAESAAEGASDGAAEEAGEELAQSAPADDDGGSEAREQQPCRTPRSPPASPKRDPAPSAGAEDPAASLASLRRLAWFLCVAVVVQMLVIVWQGMRLAELSDAGEGGRTCKPASQGE